MEFDGDTKALDGAERSAKERFENACANGAALPAAVLKRLLGRRWKDFLETPSLLVVVRVRSVSWVAPVARACRKMACWNYTIEGDKGLKSVNAAQDEVIALVAAGERILGVFQEGARVPSFLLDAADIVVDIENVDARDVAEAFRTVTGHPARGVTAALPDKVDLVSAMTAIRKGSTPAACLRRLKGILVPTKAVDPLVSTATPLDDLRGYGAAMAWARQLVFDLDEWRAGRLRLKDIERNVVLAGPPGTGKSTFARSLAKSSGLPLVTGSVGTMFSSSAGYLDSIVKAIDALFQAALDAGPAAILFIDELEAFPARESLNGREGSWWIPVVTHLLTRLDSALSDASDRLIVVGATNYPERLDAALTRPGRLDRIVHIGLPTVEDLPEIYRQHLGDELAGVDLSVVASLSLGMTGAAVAGTVKGARARARGQKRELRLDDLLDRVAPNEAMHPDDLLRACVHEAGHVVVSRRLALPKVLSVCVGFDGATRGGRVSYADDGRLCETVQDIEASVVRMLAGRAAEECILGAPSSGAGGGAGSDIAKATELLAIAKTSLGLQGSLAYFAQPDRAMATVQANPALMREIVPVLDRLYRRALELAKESRPAIEAIAQALGKERLLVGTRIDEILEASEVEEKRARP